MSLKKCFMGTETRELKDKKVKEKVMRSAWKKRVESLALKKKLARRTTKN